MRRGFVLALVVLAGVLAAPAPAAVTIFESDVYYVDPSPSSPGGMLATWSGTPLDISIDGQGFDISPKKLVWANPGSAELNVVKPGGAVDTVELDGLFAPARPSLSPDGSQVAIQATETLVDPEVGPQNLAIYVVGLASGEWRRLTDLPPEPVPGYEVPEWLFPGDRIAYWAADGGCQVIRIVDAVTGDVEVEIKDDGPTGCFTPNESTGPRFHFTASRDGDLILIAGQLQIYDSHTAELLDDVRDETLELLAGAGYVPDERFAGQGGGGTAPLDATFSDNASSIMFDAAVRKVSDGSYGVLVGWIDRAATVLEIAVDPIDVEPSLSNNHNFSQLNPVWLPTYEPDGKIKVSTAKSFADSATANAPPGATRTFLIKLKNLAFAPDSFTVTGPRSFDGLTIKYLAGTRNITDDVTHGRYSTGFIDARRSKTIKLVVTSDRSMVGTTSTLPVRLTSFFSGIKDTATARLRVN
jgi:hypothetical protein